MTLNVTSHEYRHMTQATATTDSRIRALWADWCAATGTGPALPPTQDALDAFFAAIPAAPTTRKRRERALGLRAESRPPSLPPLRTGEGWADPGRALAQAQTWGMPAGLRGRRDAWLILLTLILRLPTRDALAVTPGRIVARPDGSIGVCGISALTAEDPRSCPACAATRWLRVAAPACHGWRADTRARLAPDEPGMHDHQRPLPEGWADARCFAPSIDRWGWVRAQPVSPVGLAAILHERQRIRPIPEPPEPVAAEQAAAFVGPSLTAAEAARQLDGAYDDIDDRIDRLSESVQQALGAAEDFGGYLQSRLGRPDDACRADS